MLPQRITFLTVIALTLISATTACDTEQAMRRFTPPEADARAREYLSLIARHQTDSAELRVLPSMSGPQTHEAFQQIGAVLGGQQIDSVRVIGVQANTINGVAHTNLSYELRTSRGWIVANVATVDSAGTWFVEGVSAQPIPKPLDQINAFSLTGKSGLHYLWLLLTIACAMFALGSAAFLATRRGMPRRWLWAFVALLGAGAFSLNWSTGAVNVRLVNVQLFAAAALKAGPAAPWVITFALPLGAIWALSRYQKWRNSAASESLQTSSAPLPDPGGSAV